MRVPRKTYALAKINKHDVLGQFAILVQCYTIIAIAEAIALIFMQKYTGVKIVRPARTLCPLIIVHSMPKSVEFQKGISYTKIFLNAVLLNTFEGECWPLGPTLHVCRSFPMDFYFLKYRLVFSAYSIL